MVDIVVLVSGTGSNLRAIAAAIDEGRCAATLRAVVSDKTEAPALAFARERGVATEVVPLRKGDDRVAWDGKLADAVARHQPALVVLAGFMRIVGPQFLRRFPGRIINVHPSLLPAFPGAHGPADAMKAGVRITGCTIHVVDDGVDTGFILAQGAVPLLPGDDPATLHRRIQAVEHQLLPRVIDWIGKGALELGPPARFTRDLRADAPPLVAPELR